MLKALTVLAAAETQAAVGRWKRTAVAYAVAAVMLIFAFGFLLVAARDWAALRYGAELANLMVVGGLVLSGLIALIVAKIVSRKPEGPSTFAKVSAVAAAPALAAATRRVPIGFTALAVTIVAGAVLGRRLAGD